MGLGQLDAAAKDYQAVVDIAKDGEMANVDPMLQAAYYSLGSIAMQQAKPAEAIAFLEKALAIKRSDADALYLVGTAYVATGETDKAETALRAAVAFVPIGWSEPYTALADGFTKAGKTAMAEWAGAMADLAAGKPELAEPRLLAIVDGDAAVDAAIGLGLLYETKGDTATAAGWYAKALAKSPDNAAARLGHEPRGRRATRVRAAGPADARRAGRREQLMTAEMTAERPPDPGRRRGPAPPAVEGEPRGAAPADSAGRRSSRCSSWASWRCS